MYFDVGWFTTIFPVRLDLEDADSPGVALKRIKEQLRRLPNQGIDDGVLRYLKNDSAIASTAMPKAEVSFNYLGQFDSMLSASSVFELAQESPGLTQDPTSQRRYLLEINASVIGGQLKLSWTYSQQIHRPEAIANLADNYLTNLLQLIEHCQSVEAGGYTPSDFSLVQLEQTQLDDILSRVEFEN